MPRHYIDEPLADVDLSSRSKNKFDRLVAVLAERWDLPPEAIGVKSLTDNKNWGNRISEATRLPIDRLVLLSKRELEPDDLAKVYASRTMGPVPVLLVGHDENGWAPRAILHPHGAENPFDEDTRILHVTLAGPPDVDDDVLADLCERVVSLAGRASDTPIASLFDDENLDERAVVVKRAPDSANLGNRIGEAIGRRPAVFVLVVPAALAESARRIAVEQLSRSPGTRAAYLVIETADGLGVESVGGLGASMAVVPNEEPEETAKIDRVMDETAAYASAETAVDEPIEYLRLERVAVLRHHLPLRGGAGQLYEEHRRSDDRLSYATPTLEYLRRLVAEPERAFVVLSGDAGHGKTYLCRRLLESGDAAADAAIMPSLAADRLGDVSRNVDGASRAVRVVKDLSEITPEAGAEALERLLAQQDDHVIVCANEGRLRDVVGRDAETLAPLLATLERGLETGQTNLPTHPDIHVVNLNHQAATANDGGFLGYALDFFLNHENAWRKCDRCAASPDCPILANRRDLANRGKRGSAGNERRAALVEAVRVVEESGHVLTFRDTLAFVAYAVTATLDCEAVERLHRRADGPSELDGYRLPGILFESRVPADRGDVVPLLRRLRRLDPGHVASRPIDERVHEALEGKNALGSGLFDVDSRQPTTREELDVERERHLALVRGARRDAWFASPEEDEHGVRRTRRLGLRHHDEFRRLLEGGDDTFVAEAVRTIACGLHTIQGAVGIETKMQLHFVDPAFGRSGSHSAVIARSLRQKQLDLVSESARWRERPGSDGDSVLDSVEWIDRRLLLVEQGSSGQPLLALDMLGFEFVVDAADGIVMRGFHSAARRRILATLARLAEQGTREHDEIRVIVDQRKATLTVGRDGKIHMEGRA